MVASDEREKYLLKNVFGSNVGEETVMNEGIGRLTRGVNPFKVDAKAVFKIAATPGRKPKVSGFGTRSRVTLSSLDAHQRFLESQKQENDIRLTYREEVLIATDYLETQALKIMSKPERAIFKKLKECRVKGSDPAEVPKPSYSEETIKKLLALVYNREEARKAYQKAKKKDRGPAAVEKKKVIKKAKRLGFKIKAKNCQDISKVFAGMSQNVTVITEKFIVARKKRRRVEKPKRR